MSRNKYCPYVIAFVLGALALSSAAQNSPLPAGSSQSTAPGQSAAESAKPILRIQIVINRFEGEKKIGSLPYSFIAVPNSAPVQMRFGVDAPVAMSNIPDQGKTGPVEYRSLSTNIDCAPIKELPGGRYLLDINLQTSAAMPSAQPEGKESRPLFRRFDSRFTAVLKDGQTMQSVVAANPVTGEVIKIDATLTIVR